MIHRVEKKKGYVCMSRQFLDDRNLSFKAKGLLSVMLSLPDDWVYSISGLTALASDGRDSVMSALEELKSKGYVVMTETRVKGRFVTNWDVYELPSGENRVGKAESELPNSENRIGKTESDNHILLNNNTKYIKPNNKEPINKTNRESSDSGSKKFIPPTVEEVRDYCSERNNGIDPEAFVDFYTSKGWMVGKNKMKDWKASVRTWERNHKGEQPKQKADFLDVDYERLEREVKGHESWGNRTAT